MAFYTIGEVAELCNVNPVTLRAWQRRYGLLKPQRTDGGHRLFTEEDIERIHEIKRWIEGGVQVSKVKALLSEEESNQQSGWHEHQATLMHHLQNSGPTQLRKWIAEVGKEHPVATLVTHLYVPLRRRLHGQQATLTAMLSLLDGILIGHISVCLAQARRRAGRDALIVGWNITDATRLWLAAWSALDQGWRPEVLAHPLTQLRPEMFPGQTLLIWCGDDPSPAQRMQIETWQQEGQPVALLG